MELNNAHVNLQNVYTTNDNVVAYNLNNINFILFWKLWKFSSRTKVICDFSYKMLWLPPKKKPHIIHFTLINVEWIKILLVNMDLSHKWKILIIFWKPFWCTYSCQTNPNFLFNKKNLFSLKIPWKKKTL
jgi:hypothetical protein